MLQSPPQNNKWRALVAAKLFALCALSLFLLTACGGGGGGGSGGSSTPTSTQNPPTTKTCSDGTVIPVGDTCPPTPAEYTRRKSEFEASNEYTVRYTSGSTSETDSHLGRINAAAAYARGATSAGQTIAIVDTGIRDTHREFVGSGKVTKVTEGGYSPDDDDKFHGTLVAALAVGNRDGGSGLNMHGVAFDANVHFTEIFLGDPPAPGSYRYFLLENHNDLDDRSLAAEFSKSIANARAAGAAIINSSFGVNGAISRYDRRELRSRFGHTAVALEQKNTPNADKTIIVWAAGNAGGHTLASGQTPVFDSPDIWSGLGVYFPELQSHILAVVALDQDGTIASYSNHCGIAKGFCLAAPGSNIVSALSSGDTAYTSGSGTSFAAPIVSGSLALLRQFFRGQLGNTELVSRLLATANREGRYANSDIYGHGLVDLDAATRPFGSLMTGLPGDPGSRPFAGSGIALSGGAFGSSLQHQLADVEVAGFDSLGAPFFQSAAAWVTQPAQERGSGIYREQRELSLAASPYQNNGATLSLGFNGDGTLSDARFSSADGWWFSYGDYGGRALGLYEQSFDTPQNPLNHLNPDFQNSQSEHEYTYGTRRFSDPLAFAAPYLSLVRDGPGMGWSHRRAGGGRFGFALMHGAPQFDGQQNPGGKRGIGALLDLTLNRGLSLQAGAVREADGFLGARPQGALGQAQGETAFLGVNGAWTLGDDWRILASAYLGRTRPQVDDSGLLHDAGAIISSAFSIGAVRALMWRRGDWFGMRLSQPLRAESGDVTLRIPTGRTKYREILYRDHKVSLAPAERNLQAGAVREADGFLGARPQGALGQAQGETAFLGVNGAWTLGDDWRILASAYLGRTRPQVDDSGLLHDAGAIISSAFSIGAVRASMWRRGDWFGMRLSQPLRAESGDVTLRIPTGRTKYREILYRDHKVSLAPAERNLQAEAVYHLPFAGGALKTSMGVEHHPQHDRASGIRPFMRLSFERRF